MKTMDVQESENKEDKTSRKKITMEKQKVKKDNLKCSGQKVQLLRTIENYDLYLYSSPNVKGNATPNLISKPTGRRKISLLFLFHFNRHFVFPKAGRADSLSALGCSTCNVYLKFLGKCGVMSAINFTLNFMRRTY